MTRTLTLAAALLVAATAASAQTRSVYTEDLTWFEIRDAMAAGKTAAIIYAGGIEQNGPHMSLVKHNLIARHVAGQIAERLGNALVYPVMPFSPAGDVTEKTGHMRFPGTVSLSSEVFLGVMRQVAQSAVAAGFKQVFLMGDHGGGQAELRLAAEGLDVDARRKGARVFYVDIATQSGQQMNAYLKERKIAPGGHAGVAETAQVVALDKEGHHIRRDRYAASAAGPEPAAGMMADVSPATAEIGRVFLEFKVTSALDQIKKLSAAAK
jgi:creatinine amidohydrolase/Fe(II)-dependent formamide hydrolase-like protein